MARRRRHRRRRRVRAAHFSAGRSNFVGPPSSALLRPSFWQILHTEKPLAHASIRVHVVQAHVHTHECRVDVICV